MIASVHNLRQDVATLDYITRIFVEENKRLQGKVVSDGTETVIDTGKIASSARFRMKKNSPKPYKTVSTINNWCYTCGKMGHYAKNCRPRVCTGQADSKSRHNYFSRRRENAQASLEKNRSSDITGTRRKRAKQSWWTRHWHYNG